MAGKLISRDDILKALNIKEPKNGSKDTLALRLALAQKAALKSVSDSQTKTKEENELANAKGAGQDHYNMVLTQQLLHASGADLNKYESIKSNPKASAKDKKLVADIDSKVQARSSKEFSKAQGAGALTAVGDVFSRGQYVGANFFQNSVTAGQKASNPLDAAVRAVKGMPGAIARGVTGKEKGNYVQVLKNAGVPAGPRIPGTNVSLRDAGGEIANVVGAPDTYMGLGVVREASAAVKAKTLAEGLAKATATHEAEGVAVKAAVKRGAKGKLESLKPLYETAEKEGKKAADALPKGKVELKVLGKPVASSESLYRAGKTLKDKLTYSELGQPIQRGFNTDAVLSEGKTLSSQGANEIIRRARNAVEARESSKTLTVAEKAKLAKVEGRQKVLDQLGTKLDNPIAQKIAESNGLVNVGGNIYTHKGVAAAVNPEPFLPKPKLDNKLINEVKDLRQVGKIQAVTSIGNKLVQNPLTDVMYNALDGLKNPKRYFQARRVLKGLEKDTFSAVGKTFSSAEVLKIMQESGADRVGFFGALKGDKATTVTGKVLGAPLHAASNISEPLERGIRTAHWLDAFEKEGKTAKTVEEAATKATDRVMKFNGDFTNLTDLEKKLKVVYPFYSWPRQNIPRVLKSIAEHPGQVAIIPKAETAINNALGQDDGSGARAGQPGYTSGDILAKFNPASMASTFVNPRTALDDVTRAVENPRGIFDPLQGLAPDVKGLAELLMHKKFNGGKTGSVADYVTDQIRVVKIIKDLADPELSESKKDAILWRFFTGAGVTEVESSQKKVAVQKEIASVKKKIAAKMVTPAKKSNQSSKSPTIDWSDSASAPSPQPPSVPTTTKAPANAGVIDWSS